MKTFLSHSNNIERSSYVWNMSGSVITAGQSVVFLIVISHVLGATDAGIFAIAYSNAYMLVTLSLYGMRNYQVSDTFHKFSFFEYLSSRLVSSLAMIAASMILVLYLSLNNGYTPFKSAVILLMCLYKLVDAFEDVFHGFYQQSGRLDVGGKCLTMRAGATAVIFIAVLMITGDLLVALAISIVVTVSLFAVFTKLTLGLFLNESERGRTKGNTFILLKTCLPLCLGAFLSIYITNAPRYAIDTFMGDEAQAYYGFLAMPSFVIVLLSGFIFGPIVYKLSVQWNAGDFKAFRKNIYKQLIIIAGVSVAAILIGYLIGLPVLSMLYGTDLRDYMPEFIMLLGGGGFWAVSGFLLATIVIIRRQKSVLIGYLAVAIISFFTAPILVKSYGLTGASAQYLLSTVLISIVFLAILFIGIVVFARRTTDK